MNKTKDRVEHIVPKALSFEYFLSLGNNCQLVIAVHGDEVGGGARTCSGDWNSLKPLKTVSIIAEK